MLPDCRTEGDLFLVPKFDIKKKDVKGIDEKTLNHFHEMAMSYYQDALSFYEQGNYINSLAALEYAEGWLDAGAALGVFDVEREL